ncbi:MAG: hypothetical protein KDA84_23680 [Planctomycetaceae bacterium]|nr:hypothetical protein [Planctomycetaceae bacterium]
MIPVSFTTTRTASSDSSIGQSGSSRLGDHWEFASATARSLIESNGFNDADRIFELIKTSIHSHKGRAVSPVSLIDESGQQVDAFVKMHWGRRRLIPRMAEIKTGQIFQNFPTMEWKGIQRLESVGLLVPERLALLRSGGLQFRDAVIVRRVPAQVSLDDSIRNGQWDALDRESQREILEGMVRVMQSIHQAGLGWRGTCTRHFFPELTSHGAWKLWLIDCEGIHPHLTHRGMSRDYRKLKRALEISGANPRTLAWFQKLVNRAMESHKTPKPRQPRKGLLVRLYPSLEPST